MDSAVTGAGGISLRYGIFYGDPEERMAGAVRARKFPIAGDGAGVWSSSTSRMPPQRPCSRSSTTEPAIYNIVDDEPAPVREWLPELATIS